MKKIKAQLGIPILRTQAELILTKNPIMISSELSEVGELKLIHELEVHQIELELQNEELIRAKEAEKDAIELYDFAPTGYFTLSPNGDIIGLNLNAAYMLGMERSALIHSRFLLFLSIDTKEIFNHFLESIFLKRVKESCEVTISISDKPPIFVSLTGIADYNHEKCFITATDITERELAEEIIKIRNHQLVLADAQKDRFISILAHDLKNPFASILGFLDLLIENINEYPQDKIEEQLSIIYQSSQNVFKLLENLLQWSQTQRGKLICDPQSINFTTICDEVINNLSLNAKNKSINIDYSETNNLTVFADANLLKTVMRNLVSNAIKFTNTGGTINISGISDSSNVTISVADNGIGIAAENIPKLFDASLTHLKIGTANEKGTGLGLFLCKKFIEKHCGKIWVESELNIGTTFRFTLPVE